jgi:hypothetical protein
LCQRCGAPIEENDFRSFEKLVRLTPGPAETLAVNEASDWDFVPQAYRVYRKSLGFGLLLRIARITDPEADPKSICRS